MARAAGRGRTNSACTTLPMKSGDASSRFTGNLLRPLSRSGPSTSTEPCAIFVRRGRDGLAWTWLPVPASTSSRRQTRLWRCAHVARSRPHQFRLRAYQEDFGTLGHKFLGVVPGHRVIRHTLDRGALALNRGDSDATWLCNRSWSSHLSLRGAGSEDPDTWLERKIVLDRCRITGPSPSTHADNTGACRSIRARCLQRAPVSHAMDAGRQVPAPSRMFDSVFQAFRRYCEGGS